VTAFAQGNLEAILERVQSFLKLPVIERFDQTRILKIMMILTESFLIKKKRKVSN
jgi:hypothetical protein